MSKSFQFLFVLASLTTISSAQTITTQTFGSGANAFTMDFVTIGNPGNVADAGGYPPPAGAVPYVYNLGKYEISRDMVIKASTAGSLGLTLQDMTSFGGNGLNRPATGTSWNEAAKFVNWLNTSKGYQAAYNFDVNGSFQLWNSGQYISSNPFRHKDAYYFIPNRDEWYKGAYGTPNGSWVLFPTASETEPFKRPEATSEGMSGAVYNGQSGPADITKAGGLSPFGTMAQGGNVAEWQESLVSFAAVGWTNGYGSASESEFREVRGGSWESVHIDLQRNCGGVMADPLYEDGYNLGFRVASVPEPSSLSLLALGGVVVALGRRKRA